MEDQVTVEEVSRERKAFNEYGGGCHLAVGINVKKFESFYIHNHRGVIEERAIKFSLLEGRELPPFLIKPTYFSGLAGDDQLVRKKPVKADLSSFNHIYVTSKHCIDSIQNAPDSLWAAGTKTMKELASKGLWVNGSADSLGDDEVKKMRAGKAIALMTDTKADLCVLSNDQATSTLGKVVACYVRELATHTDNSFDEKINKTDVFYWTSFFQYQAYMAKYPHLIDRIHVTGLGKTYSQFKEKNINVLPMTSMEEFKNWIML